MQNKDHVIVNRFSTKHSKKSTHNTYRSDTGQVQKSASGKKEQHMLQINLQHTILQTAWAQRLERLYKTTGRESMHEKYTEKKHRTLKRHDFYQSRPRKNRQIKKNLVRPSLQRLRMSIGLFVSNIFWKFFWFPLRELAWSCQIFPTRNSRAGYTSFMSEVLMSKRVCVHTTLF